MKKGTYPQGKASSMEATMSSHDDQPDRRKPSIIAIVLWCVGLIGLIAASAMVIMHPGPWPIDLQTTITIQHWQLWPWVRACVDFVNVFDGPIVSGVELALWFLVLAVLRHFVLAFFIAGGTALANFADALLSVIVARPRPSSPLIHVYMPEPFHSFPSGHTEYSVVYYGFLLYLSLSKPVSGWRYRWLLLPLQIFAALNIILIGYARIEAGSHWLTDSLGGYLSGTLLLTLLIFLYHRALDMLARHRAKKQELASKTA